MDIIFCTPPVKWDCPFIEDIIFNCSAWASPFNGECYCSLNCSEYSLCGIPYSAWSFSLLGDFCFSQPSNCSLPFPVHLAIFYIKSTAQKNNTILVFPIFLIIFILKIFFVKNRFFAIFCNSVVTDCIMTFSRHLL